jgi:Transcriptional regulator, AbiEi antitoxin/REase_MTES_1575
VSQLRPAERAATCAAAQRGHITSEQCRDCGLSPSAVRRLVARGAWERVAPGVYRIVGAPLTWHGRALAAVLAAGPEALASHRTAAHLWGLEGFGPPGRIEVTVRRHSRPRQRSGVTVHETLAFDLTSPRVRWGVPTVGPARVLVDLAGIGCDELVLLRALDEVRRLHLASWPTLWETFLLHAHRGRPGIVACRSVLLRRWGRRVPDTEFARLFGRLLDDAGLPEPVFEHAVAAGDAHYSIDVAYPAERIAIELDGKGHATEEAFESDRIRENRLKLSGWTVLRYTWQRFITAPGEVVAEVREALRQADALPPYPNRRPKATKTGTSERRNAAVSTSQPNRRPKATKTGTSERRNAANRS